MGHRILNKVAKIVVKLGSVRDRLMAHGPPPPHSQSLVDFFPVLEEECICRICGSIFPSSQTSPFILETEPDQGFLDIMIATGSSELIYCRPANHPRLCPLFSASPPTVIPSGFRWSCRIFVKEACPNIEFILGFQEVIQFYAQTSLNLEEFKSMSSNIFTSADSNLRAGSSSVHLVHWG